MHEASLSHKGVWPLFKHNHLHSKILKALPKFSPLQRGEITAELFEQKDALLREVLFPPPAAAKLDDIATARYPPEIQIPKRVGQEEVVAIIRGLKPDKAPGVDGIPNRIL